ncbi:MAG: hypothetical protein AB1480_14140 [Nitrospirota bacterium]
MGRFGSAILHAGFLCVIIAALYSLALQQRGFVQLIETETFKGIHKRFRPSADGVRFNRLADIYVQTNREINTCYSQLLKGMQSAV